MPMAFETSVTWETRSNYSILKQYFRSRARREAPRALPPGCNSPPGGAIGHPQTPPSGMR
eukprot:scaffold6967_cov38-Tisochrysis_lutea.AAC.2